MASHSQPNESLIQDDLFNDQQEEQEEEEEEQFDNFEDEGFQNLTHQSSSVSSLPQKSCEGEEELLYNMPFNKSSFENNGFYSRSDLKLPDISNNNVLVSDSAKGQQQQQIIGEPLATFSAQREDSTSGFQGFQFPGKDAYETKSSVSLKQYKQEDFTTFNRQAISLGQLKNIQKSISSYGISEGQFEIEGGTGRRGAREEEVEELRQMITDLEQEVIFLRPLAQKQEEFKQQLRQSQERESQLKEQLASMQNSFKQNGGEEESKVISQLKQKVEQLKIQNEELQNQVNRLQENCDQWKNRAERERSENKSLKSNRDSEINEHDKLREAFDELQERYNNMEANQEERDSLQQIEHKAKIFGLEQEKDSLKLKNIQEIKEQENIIQYLREQISSQKLQIKELTQYNNNNNKLSSRDNQTDSISLREYQESIFDAIANDVCLFVHDLRNSSCYEQLRSSFNKEFQELMDIYDIGVIEYEQLRIFISTSLKQLESYMSSFLNSNLQKISMVNDAEIKYNLLIAEMEDIKQNKKMKMTEHVLGYKVDDLEGKLEQQTLLKMEAEMLTQDLREKVLLLKGEYNAFEKKLLNKQEKERIFFEKILEVVTSAINHKQISAICQDVVDKKREITKNKVIKAQQLRKIKETDQNLKSQLHKQSSKELIPLKKLKDQCKAEFDSVVLKIREIKEKMWASYDRLQQECMYEKRVKEDLLECEREYLKLKILVQENKNQGIDLNNNRDKKTFGKPPVVLPQKKTDNDVLMGIFQRQRTNRSTSHHNDGLKVNQYQSSTERQNNQIPVKESLTERYAEKKDYYLRNSNEQYQIRTEEREDLKNRKRTTSVNQTERSSIYHQIDKTVKEKNQSVKHKNEETIFYFDDDRTIGKENNKKNILANLEIKSVKYTSNSINGKGGGIEFSNKAASLKDKLDKNKQHLQLKSEY